MPGFYIGGVPVDPPTYEPPDRPIEQAFVGQTRGPDGRLVDHDPGAVKAAEAAMLREVWGETPTHHQRSDVEDVGRGITPRLDRDAAVEAALAGKRHPRIASRPAAPDSAVPSGSYQKVNGQMRWVTDEEKWDPMNARGTRGT